MAGRRTKGEGSVYQRESDGRWVGVVDLGWVGGKRLRRTVTAHTLRELRPKLKALKSQIESGVMSDDSTVERWVRYWLTEVAPRKVRARTLQGYAGYAETWIIPTLGKRRLGKLQPEHVRGLHRVMEDAGKSPTTVLQCHAILQRCLKVAVMDGRIPYNPAERVDRPTAAKNPHGALTRDETMALLDLLAAYGDDGLWSLTSRYLVALLAGLRQGEALGLRWEDVTLEHGRESLRLARSVQRQVGKGLVVSPLKSASSARTIPLMPPVAEALRRHRADAADGYVWGALAPTDPRRDWGTWKGLLWSAGCADHPLHSARSTTASILAEAQVAPRVIADVLGHVDFDVAWTHYIEADDRQRRAGIAAGWASLTAET